MDSELAAEETPDQLGMTDAQWVQFQAYTCGYGEQDEYGIDLSLLRENLKLTPTQRLERHRQALRLSLEVQRAGRMPDVPDISGESGKIGAWKPGRRSGGTSSTVSRSRIKTGLICRTCGPICG